MSDPIFVSIPQPPQKQRIVRVPDDALLRGLAAKGGVERMYLKKDTEVHDVTPEEMGSAGWVPQSALDTQVEATLSNIRRAGHFDREREEARDTIARAWEHITDSPVGVRTLDVEIARLVRERDKARAERDEARRERDEEIGLQKAELNDATLERDKVRTETPEPRRQQGPAAKVQSGWALPARLELDELERTVSVARGVLGAEPTEGIVQAAEKAIRERDDSVKRLEALTSTLVKLFEWDEDPSFLHAATHIENAVMNLRTNLSVTTRERDEARAGRDEVQRQLYEARSATERLLRDQDQLAETVQAAHLVLGSPFGTSILDSVRCAVTQREEALCKVARVEKERDKARGLLEAVERDRDEARDTIARARGCITDVPAGVRNALDVEVARVVRDLAETREALAKMRADRDEVCGERDGLRWKYDDVIRERNEARASLDATCREISGVIQALPHEKAPHDLAGAVALITRQRDEARAERDRLMEAAIWMSGSSDFSPGGQAHEAFARDVAPLLQGSPVPAAEPRATERPPCDVPGCAARIRWTVLGPGPSWVHYCDEHRPPRETPVQAAEAPMPRATDEELGSVARRAFPHRVNEDSDVSIEDLEKVALAVAARVRREQCLVTRAVAPGSPAHVELWDAINTFAVASGGSASAISGARMDAVRRVEKALAHLLGEVTRG